MPWTAGDAKKHIKGLEGSQASAWAKIANAALREYADEGRAIRTANARVKRVSPSGGQDSDRNRKRR